VNSARLQDWPLLGNDLKEPGHLQMVWTSGKQLSSKIRVFVDFISEFIYQQRQDSASANSE
jgi:DNA-binding transcriptional LysR family regulator